MSRTQRLRLRSPKGRSAGFSLLFLTSMLLTSGCASASLKTHSLKTTPPRATLDCDIELWQFPQRGDGSIDFSGKVTLPFYDFYQITVNRLRWIAYGKAWIKLHAKKKEPSAHAK